MTLKTLSFSIIFLLLMSSCSFSEIDFELIEIKELEGIPSASGIEETKYGRFIIGDNSPWLFKVDKENVVIDKIQLLPNKILPDSIFEKMVKPDFEAMTKTDKKGDVIFIFGSGSKSPERDVLVEVNLSGEVTTKEYSLKEIYDGLRTAANLPTEDLNIEAAEVVEEELYLFNRGKNIIAKYSLPGFLNYLQTGGKPPVPEVFKVNLPKIDNIESGFSGASFLEAANSLVFTATVENTSNWIDDGEVLGSFLGLIKITDLRSNIEPSCTMIQQNEKTLQIKVESVTVLSEEKGTAELLLVTDSDGDISEILRGNLSYSE